MEEIMRAMIGKIDTCIIAKIVKVESGFIDVEPQAEYKSIMLPPILHVPMCQLGNRQLKMKIKFKAGDIVPVLICSRDISGYISKETAVMNTNKRHNLSNAIALPLLISTDINTENFPRSIEIDGDVVLNGNFTINGDVKITGKLQVGSIESGKINAKSLDVESGISKGSIDYIHP